MQEILQAKAPYGIIKEADALIQTVDAVNKTLITQRRTEAVAKIDKLIAALRTELENATADNALRASCLSPLEMLKQQVSQQESLAHIAQAEGEALRAFDVALAKINEWLAKQQEQAKEKGKPKPLPVKPVQVVKPADLAPATYLETEADIEAYLDKLRKALKAAVAENKRIQIR
jgi:hypothetical protein